MQHAEHDETIHNVSFSSHDNAESYVCYDEFAEYSDPCERAAAIAKKFNQIFNHGQNYTSNQPLGLWQWLKSHFYFDRSETRSLVLEDNKSWLFKHFSFYEEGQYKIVTIDGKPQMVTARPGIALRLRKFLSFWIESSSSNNKSIFDPGKFSFRRNVHFIYVPKGELAKVVVDGNPRFLAEGHYLFNTAYFHFEGLSDPNTATLSIGNNLVRRFLLQAGEVLVAANGREQHVLTPQVNESGLNEPIFLTQEYTNVKVVNVAQRNISITDKEQGGYKVIFHDKSSCIMNIKVFYHVFDPIVAFNTFSDYQELDAFLHNHVKYLLQNIIREMGYADLELAYLHQELRAALVYDLEQKGIELDGVNILDTLHEPKPDNTEEQAAKAAAEESLQQELTRNKAEAATKIMQAETEAKLALIKAETEAKSKIIAEKAKQEMASLQKSKPAPATSTPPTLPPLQIPPPGLFSGYDGRFSPTISISYPLSPTHAPYPLTPIYSGMQSGGSLGIVSCTNTGSRVRSSTLGSIS